MSLEAVRARARKMCESLNLSGLSKQIEKCTKLGLDMFFSVKTHKVGTPFRVLLSERHIWQKAVGLFLQKHLGLSEVGDPFQTRNSEEVCDFSIIC